MSILSAIAPLSDMDEIRQLLLRCDLPVGDISGHRHRFFGIRDGHELVAVVGFESFESAGLLRSLAVAPGWRHLGLGRRLISHVEWVAADEGVAALYLLTTTASAFFSKLGYENLPRTEAPEAISATSQFSGVCPLSSDMFGRKLGAKDKGEAR